MLRLGRADRRFRQQLWCGHGPIEAGATCGRVELWSLDGLAIDWGEESAIREAAALVVVVVVVESRVGIEEKASLVHPAES